MLSLLNSLALYLSARTHGIASLRIDQHLDVHVAAFGVQPVAK